LKHESEVDVGTDSRILDEFTRPTGKIQANSHSTESGYLSDQLTGSEDANKVEMEDIFDEIDSQK
jgi:hypothetical protein